MSVLKSLIIFVAGAAVGGVVAYKYLDRKMAEKCDAEIEEAKEHYKQKAEAVTESVNDLIDRYEKPVDNENNSPKDIANKQNELKDRYKDVLQKKNYSDMFKAGSEDKPVPSMDDIAKDPYVISAEDFVNENVYADKVTLTYYEEDDVLVDEENNIVDIEHYIGTQAISRIGEFEPDVVYVRNEDMNTDFEVYCEHTYYDASFHGGNLMEE